MSLPSRIQLHVIFHFRQFLVTRVTSVIIYKFLSLHLHWSIWMTCNYYMMSRIVCIRHDLISIKFRSQVSSRDTAFLFVPFFFFSFSTGYGPRLGPLFSVSSLFSGCLLILLFVHLFLIFVFLVLLLGYSCFLQLLFLALAVPVLMSILLSLGSFYVFCSAVADWTGETFEQRWPSTLYS